jgi:hypothetical protein
MTLCSENEEFSSDSLESNKMKKNVDPFERKKRRKSYLEIYQRQLTYEKSKAEPKRRVRNVIEIPQSLWNQFVSQQHKSKITAVCGNCKSQKLQKRLEYGRQMSLLNRVNSLCSNARNEKQKTRAQSLTDIETKRSGCNKALKSSSGKFTQNAEKLQQKLQQMKIRHDCDVKRVDKIQKTLKIANTKDRHCENFDIFE